jgi:hypothetical protein
MRYVIDDGNISYVRTGLDNLGLLFDLPRLPEENNAAYRARIESMFAKPGNATYTGMVNSVAREFGYSAVDAVTIACTSEDPTANPKIILQNQTLSLYLTPTDLEGQWFLRDATVNTITKLAQAINETTSFTATVNSDVTGNESSMGLIQKSSHDWVIDEIIPASTSFHLKHAPIVPHTIVFEDTDVFYRYIATPAKAGDFSIDLTTGLIKTISMPDGQSHIAYVYQNNITTLQYLPIGLLNLNSQEARHWFFTTKSTNIWDSPENSLYPAKPHGFMQRIINELMKNCPSQWGP